MDEQTRETIQGLSDRLADVIDANFQVIDSMHLIRAAVIELNNRVLALEQQQAALSAKMNGTPGKN
jgi:hypothetical protein